MEDKLLIEKVKNNEDGAFDYLLNKYRHMIYKIIRECDYDGCFVDENDLFQEACIMLYDSCFSYSDDRGMKYSSFVYMTIRRRLHRYLYKLRRIHYMEVVSIDNEELYTKVYQKQSYVCEQKYDYSFYEKKQRDINNFLSGLNKLDFEVLGLRKDGKTYKEIAETLKITPKKVDNTLQRLKREYKESLS